MILVFNCGSSSVKFAVFEPRLSGLTQMISGQVSRIGKSDAELLCQGDLTIRERISAPSHRSAVHEVLKRLRRNEHLSEDTAVGHRIVHGGKEFAAPTLITPQVIKRLKQIIPLAPTHLPAELSAIEEVAAALPKALQIATFDTAFHSRKPIVARRFALPRQVEALGVTRYGFHGLSCEYVLRALKRMGEKPKRLVIAHLGNGASVTAVENGKSIDTTMGMTPLGGIPMGTRPGDLDPGVFLFLLRQGYTTERLDKLFNAQSGLLGLSGISSEVEKLLKSDSKDAAEAIQIFAYAVRKNIAACAAALGGLDALVFTGGVGENAPQVRQLAVKGLPFLRIRLDAKKNRANEELISLPNALPVYRIRTNEEVVIAEHVRQLIKSMRSTKRGKHG